MRKIALLLFFFVLTIANSDAQRFGYVDMDKVLEAIPDYSKAQKELEEIAERWRQEISRDYDKIDQMYRDYQAREVLMSDEMKKQKQDEIVAKEKDVRELQKKRFGPEGELFQKRQSMVKPIQEKVYSAIEKFANERNYDVIFTAPDGTTMIYAKADKDITADIIKVVQK
jgi:outer membrane protein